MESHCRISANETIEMIIMKTKLSFKRLPGYDNMRSKESSRNVEVELEVMKRKGMAKVRNALSDSNESCSGIGSE